MPESGLSTEVKKMVAAHLATMDHVETLLALTRMAPAPVTTADLAREMKRPEALVAVALKDLVTSGLVMSSGSGAAERFHYEPRSEELRKATEELAEVYNTHPVTLIRTVYSRVPDPVTSFADAFRIRGGDK
jgi:predicted transcriptional regulator